MTHITQAQQHNAQAKQALNKPITYVPRVKEDIPQAQTTTAVIPDQSSLHRIQVIQLATLMKRERLTVAEIKSARNLIATVIPAENRGRYYTALQEKVIYVNQRDSQARDTKGTRIEDRVYGGTCNVASLAMTLKYMGLTKEELVAFLTKRGFKQDTTHMQYEDLVEYAGQYGVKKWDRYNNNQLGALAQALGYTSYQIKGSNGYLDQKWYEKNVLPELQSGSGALMSINGHIVRIQGMNAQGLIVDDPFGTTTLKPGLGKAGNYAIAAANDDGTKLGYTYADKKVEGDWNEGEDNIWSWASLKAHGTFWVRVVK